MVLVALGAADVIAHHPASLDYPLQVELARNLLSFPGKESVLEGFGVGLRDPVPPVLYTGRPMPTGLWH